MYIVKVVGTEYIGDNMQLIICWLCWIFMLSVFYDTIKT